MKSRWAANGWLRRAGVPVALVAGVLAIGVSTAGALTGTATITAGSLSATFPSSLTWSDALNGTDQTARDTVSGDDAYSVVDATGSNSGWNVNAAATAFTDGSGDTLGDFTSNGSTSAATDTTKPSAACHSGSTCTLPTNSISDPVTIATTATKIFNAAANTGEGSIDVSGSEWWIAIPAATVPGTYTSTVTLAVTSGP